MNQLGRTMRTLTGLAVAAVILSSNPAQAQSSTVVLNNALDAGVGWFTLLDPTNPNSLELVNVTLARSNQDNYMLTYEVFDFGGGFSASGGGTVPSSMVVATEGSVSSGKVGLSINVNTCDPAFTTFGTCGTVNLTWVEIPASVLGYTDIRGDTHTLLPAGGGMIVTNGEQKNYSATVTGTVLTFNVPPSTIGGFTQETNTTKTITRP